MGGSTTALMAAALLASLAAVDTSTISYEKETRQMFVEWKAKYGKTFKGVGEEECRYAVFKNARRRVARAHYAGITSSGLNALSHLSSEEIFRGFGVRTGEEFFELKTRRMFVRWKAKYGKTYRDSGEEECRYRLFKGKHRVIVRLNAAAGETSYDINQFGDHTDEEVQENCYGGGGEIRNHPEMEGELTARCQAAATNLPDYYGSERLIWYKVCRCIAMELKQSSLEGVPLLEMKHNPFVAAE